MIPILGCLGVADESVPGLLQLARECLCGREKIVAIIRNALSRA